jgi:hypothetical protein
MAIERRGQQLDLWMRLTQVMFELATSASSQAALAANLSARELEEEGTK